MIVPTRWMPGAQLMLFRLIILTQTIEWYVANNVINYEKGMSNAEIYTAKVGGYINKKVKEKGINGESEKFI